MCDVDVEFWRLINHPKDVEDVLCFLKKREWPKLEVEGGKVLTKEDLRRKVDSLDLSTISYISRTSGTTGKPIVTPKTYSSQIWFAAANVFDLILNDWKLEKGDKIACILAKCSSYEERMLESGCIIYSIPLQPLKDIEKVLENIQPTHIYTYPSILAQTRIPPSCTHSRSCGENGATSYSSEETGIIALKSKRCCNKYHILPNIVVENHPEHGVLITDLTNPIITRYTLGDVIVLDDMKCNCGWDTSTIAEVLGRMRGFLKLKNGDKIWPTVGEPLFREISPKILQHQAIQLSHEELILKVKVSDRLNASETQNLLELVKKSLKVEIEVTVEEVDDFPPGKHECFISLV